MSTWLVRELSFQSAPVTSNLGRQRRNFFEDLQSLQVFLVDNELEIRNAVDFVLARLSTFVQPSSFSLHSRKVRRAPPFSRVGA